MQYASQNKTHVSKDFLSKEELELLRKGPVLRVEPLCRGGKVYEIRKGGLHFATLQEVISGAQS